MHTTNWTTATAFLLAAYAAVLLFFVIRAARRTRSLADYAVGSQGFSPWIVGLSLAASVTSAATFVINPGFVALYGWSAFLAMSVILPLGLIGSLVVLTRSFRQYGATVKALTLAQWMGKRYGSTGLARWFALLSLLLITFIVLICVGLTKVIAPALGAGELPVLIGMIVFVFGYMMFGGANSLVYTNTIQAILMLVVAFIMLGSGWAYWRDGFSGFQQQLAAIDPALTGAINPGSALFRDWFEVAFCNFVVGVAIVCQPHIVTRSLMLRNDGDVSRYLIIGISAQIIFFAVLLVGFYARLQFPDLRADGMPLKMDGIIPAYVVRVFPVGAGLLVILGLLSAGLSTLEGLIQSVSTTLTADLIDPLAGAALGSGEQRAERLSVVNKLVIVALAVVSAVWSYDQLLHPNLSVGILAQNGVYAFFSAAFVPVLFGIFGKNTSVLAPAAASVTAVLVHFSVYYGGLTPYTDGAVRNPAVAAALAILCSVAVGLGMQAISARKAALKTTAFLAAVLMAAGLAAQTNSMQEISYPADTRTITLSGGTEIAYTDRGTGPATLVFVHGLGSNLKAWQKNTDSLSRFYRCIALDLPGYGKSAKGDFPYGMAFFAGQLRAFLDTLDLQHVVLVGHSMGGQVALTLALQKTARLDKLVLIAPAGIETFSEAEKNWFRMVYTPEVVKNTPPEQIRRNFLLNFHRWPADADFMIEDRFFLRQTAEYEAWCRMIPQCVNGMLSEPVFDRLGEVALPTLIIYGENDALIPNTILHKDQNTRQIGELARHSIPGSRLLMFPECGHFVNWEQADMTNRAIREFLEP